MKKNVRAIKGITERWEKEEKHYRELESIIYDFLENSIFEIELFPIISHRVKSLSSIIKTSIKKGKKYSQIKDKLGFRIICHFKSELDKIKDFILNNFIVLKSESKAKVLKLNEVGYISDHYLGKVKTNRIKKPLKKVLQKIVFEIQVRTLCQHTWADLEHDLAYKEVIDLDEISKRRIFQIASLLEISDDEFDRINSLIMKNEKYKPIYVMKKLEGKFFKYAKQDYDREIAFRTINILKALLNIDNISTDMNSIMKFIEKNDTKIRNIYQERHQELKKNIFLSQPEIFLIWYFIEKKKFDIIDLWMKNFDINELSKLATWWGMPLPDYN
jgi:ppGpp synthetase/RelA/SpoT-type nucleotidyltranferase